ncbi:MAG: hypothetical protein IJ071_02815 [Ruminococcus sp.]|nr:hypothetical protein [Ruminococcus sp.]
MKGFFSNIWTKRVFAVIGALYTVAVCWLCYYSIFYDIHVQSKASVCLMVSGISVLALVIMLYTRKQILTRICSFIILPAMLPVVLLYFGKWEIIVPVIITGVVILLLSGAGEGVKTAIGTIVLLLYIFGALGYFLFTSFFVSSAKQTTVKSGVSPSGRYRYTVVNTEDSSNGSTAVYVEPNFADVTYPMVTFTLKNEKRVVYQVRPISEQIDIQWTTQSRQQITAELEQVSENITVHLTESELESFGYSYDSRLQLTDINIYDLFAIGKGATDVDPIRLDTLNDEQLAHFGIAKDGTGRYYITDPSDEVLLDVSKNRGEKVYFSELSEDGFDAWEDSHLDDYYEPRFKIEADQSLYLKDLSDQQLAQLGVSESGDVMSFNGKVCFRYYVAELDDYYDVDSRHLSVDLLN